MSESKVYCQRCESRLVGFKLFSVTTSEARVIKKDRAKAKEYVPYFYGYVCLDCAKEAGQLQYILSMFRVLSPESFQGF